MTKRSVAQRFARLAIRGYQVSLSGFAGRQCRYLPTCSEYMDEAIGAHGLWYGSWMGTARLCRCHPWGGSGYDPIPATMSRQTTWYTPWRSAAWQTPGRGALQERASNWADKA